MCTCPADVSKIEDLCPECLKEYLEWCAEVDTLLLPVEPTPPPPPIPVDWR
jgi:hypothetical protein